MTTPISQTYSFSQCSANTTMKTIIYADGSTVTTLKDGSKTWKETWKPKKPSSTTTSLKTCTDKPSKPSLPKPFLSAKELYYSLYENHIVDDVKGPIAIIKQEERRKMEDEIAIRKEKVKENPVLVEKVRQLLPKPDQAFYMKTERLDDCTICVMFTGYCPVHYRVHDSVWFEYKAYKKQKYAVWKCFRDDQYCLAKYIQ